LAKLDRKRPKKGSNDDWTHPHDPDARITKMKDGRTHLAHKAEHAVDMETGAIVAVTLHGADGGDTATIPETVAEAGERITSVVANTHGDEVVKQVSTDGPREVVTDKGYHSRALVNELTEWGLRTYCSEPNRGRQHWRGQQREQQAVYANRRRIRGREASGCYASAVRSWSDGINTCMIGAGCDGCTCEVGKTFSNGWWCTRAPRIWGC
jgi:transposase